MHKRIIPIIIVLLTVGVQDMPAQSFLDKVKKQAGKALKEHVEKAVKGNRTTDRSKSQQTAGPKVQQKKPETPKFVAIPSEHTAFFEPIGYPTTSGKLDGKAMQPITKQSQVQTWVNAQVGVEFSTNRRLVDEYLEYEKYLASGQNQWEGNHTRRDLLLAEIRKRSGEIDNFAGKLKFAKNPDDINNAEGVNVILSFGKLLDSEMYKRTLNSSIAPLKPYLREETLKYLESYGDLATLHSEAKTSWYPYAEIEKVQTSIEGLEGLVDLSGEIDVKGMKFTIKGKEATLSSVDVINMNAEEVHIPGNIIRKGVSYPVTKIGEGAFARAAAKVVRIPNTVKVLERYAFLEMPNLTAVEIPESVTELGLSCFEKCQELMEVRLPESVRKIDRFCFRDCKKLQTAVLPSSIKQFEERVFANCSSLTSVNLPEDLAGIPYQTFFGCRNLTAIKIPATVKSIGDSAFEGCSKFKSIELPDGLLEIGSRAFANCSGITSLVIPASVEDFGGGLTKGCKALKSVTMHSRYNNFYQLAGIFGETEIFPSSYFNTASIPAAFKFVD